MRVHVDHLERQLVLSDEGSPPHAVGGASFSPLPVRDAWEAADLLRPAQRDEPTLARLRALLRGLGAGTIWDKDDHFVLREIGRALLDGRLRVWSRPFLREASQATRKEPEPIFLDEPVREVETTWIELLVVDNATDDPIPDIELFVTLPDGSESSYTTDREGKIRIDDIAEGACSFRADRGERDLLRTLIFDSISEVQVSPKAVAAVHETWRRKAVREMVPEGKRNAATEDLALSVVIEHKVRTGDTMASIAEAHGYSEAELTEYNFGTTDEKEVQKMLRREVGCSERDAETGLYLFSDHDFPGKIFVPKELKRSGQQTGMCHVIRTYPPDPYPPPFILSA